MTKYFLLAIMSIFSVSLFAQQRTIKGTVKDKAGDPLVGASITVIGSNRIGVAAEQDGSFTINIPNSLNSIKVSYINYKPQIINVQSKTTVKVILEEDDSFLNEVVVVGYGKQKRVSITGAISSVTGKEVVKRNATNLSSALQGMMPGVSVVQASGQPGQDGGSIQIRGIGSKYASKAPLFLIDGIESDINGLDMNMVESVSVLKDASAAIYGSRSTNGVILITTKRGQKGAPRISYNGFTSLSMPTEMPKPVNGADYMRYFNAAKIQDKESPTYSQEIIEEYEKYGADNWTTFDTDWIGEIMNKTAILHKHSLSLSGGSEHFNYLAGGSFQHQGGMIDNNNFNRITFRLNTDSKLTSWARLGLDVNMRYNVELTPSMATPVEIIGQSLTLSPILPGINRDGTFAGGNSGYNPIAILRDGGTRKYHVSDNSLRGSLVLNPVKGFEVSTLINVKLQEDWEDSHKNKLHLYTQGNPNFSYPSNLDENGETSYTKKRVFAYQFNFQSSYERMIANHNFKILGGMQVEYLDSKTIQGTGTNFVSPNYTEFFNGGTRTLQGQRFETALVGYFGRFNYDYKEKYILEFTGRYDGSSRFITDRWGFFPGGLAAWRISEEAFFSKIKNTVNELKYRVSYSHLGNQALTNYYPFISQIYSGTYEGYYFGDDQFYNGAVLKEYFNKRISWETSVQFNTGIDLAFLKRRLNVSFDFFRRDIEDFIDKPEQSNYTGYAPAFYNVGKMRNQGFELQATWKDKIGDLNYTITATFSDAKSTWVKLIKEVDSGFDQVKSGQLCRQIVGFRTDGFFQNQEDVQNSATLEIDKKYIRPGDVKYRDINNDGVINAAGDAVILGDNTPRYEYSLNLSAQWKNFDCTIFLQGVGKREKNYNGSGSRPLLNGRSMYEYQTDFWREDNPNARFPALTLRKTENNYASDQWVKSAAYLRLKNIVVGYTLPQRYLDKVKIDHLRVYLSAQNLLTIKKGFPGFDPEGDNSYNGTFYPIMRVFSFGLDLRF